MKIKEREKIIKGCEKIIKNKTYKNEEAKPREHQS